jgi:hypothetical protein
MNLFQSREEKNQHYCSRVGCRFVICILVTQICQSFGPHGCKELPKFIECITVQRFSFCLIWLVSESLIFLCELIGKSNMLLSAHQNICELNDVNSFLQKSSHIRVARRGLPSWIFKMDSEQSLLQTKSEKILKAFMMC